MIDQSRIDLDLDRGCLTVLGLNEDIEDSVVWQWKVKKKKKLEPCFVLVMSLKGCKFEILLGYA